MSKTVEIEVVPPANTPFKCANAAHLKSGNDAATAKQLTKLFADAQTGMRRVVALGLFAWEVKENQLKHGEFGPWLAENCPKLATADSVTGRPRPSRALSGYMELTKNVLESVGFPSIEKYLGEASKFANLRICAGGNFLLLPDKKVPAEAKPLREKICALVDGKTQRQLFLEFKQSEEDDDGNRKVKRGRVKGSKGLTKEQREKAAMRDEQTRINEIEENGLETIKWLLEFADAKNAGTQTDTLLTNMRDACDTVSGFCKRLLESRKGTAK